LKSYENSIFTQNQYIPPLDVKPKVKQTNGEKVYETNFLGRGFQSGPPLYGNGIQKHDFDI